MLDIVQNVIGSLTTSITVSFFLSELEALVQQNRLALGLWSLPVIATSITFFGAYYLYRLSKLPTSLVTVSKFIISFELSRTATLITLSAFLLLFSVWNISMLNTKEHFVDSVAVENAALNWNFQDPITGILSFRYFLLHTSIILFQNPRIIPLLSSAVMLLLTYYIGFKVSKKRFCGIIAMVMLLQSETFLKYSSSATYDYSWVAFYLGSLSIMFLRPAFSIIPFIFSFLAKGLTVLFVPMSMFFFHNVETKQNRKLTFMLYGLFLLFFVMYFIGSKEINSMQYHSNEFLTGFTTLENLLKTEGVFLVLLMPVTFGLYHISKRNPYANSMLVFILSSLIVLPILSGFTNILHGQYRLIPIIVFFSIGFSTLFADQTTTEKVKDKSNISKIIFLSTLIVVILMLIPIIFPYIIERHYRIVL